MRYQTHDNPTSNFNLSTSTYAFVSGSPSGTIDTGATDISALTRGQSIFLNIASGTSGGFTTNGEYYVIPVNASGFQIASTKSNAMDGTYATAASGYCSSGTIYPNYSVGGVLVTNTAGDVYIRGIDNKKTGWSSFSKQTTSVDGSVIPYMVGSVSTSGLTASELVVWSQ